MAREVVQLFKNNEVCHCVWFIKNLEDVCLAYFVNYFFETQNENQSVTSEANNNIDKTNVNLCDDVSSEDKDCETINH